MMHNAPIKMQYKDMESGNYKIVHVYDFMHDTFETLQSFALCWCPWNNSWLTINVAMLIPVSDNKTKILNEDKG